MNENISGGSFKVRSLLTDNPLISTDVSAQAAVNATPSSGGITYTVADIASNDGAVMAFYNWDGALVENLILPRIASNKATRYESYISVSNNSVNYVKF